MLRKKPRKHPKSKCDECRSLHPTKRLTFFKGRMLCFKCHPNKIMPYFKPLYENKTFK